MSMFEPLFIRVIEWTVTGRPVQAFLAEATSISRKTWDAGGPKRRGVKARAAREVQESGIQYLRDKGMSEADIEAWLSKFPETTDEEPYCLSTLVRMFPLGPEPPNKTLALATRMDELAHTLSKAKRDGDFGACKHTLLDSPLLESNYFADTERELGINETPHALRQAKMATDWDELNTPIKAVTANLLFSLMACWDLEFCQSYFTTMRPFPLFESVMLRTAHDLQVNPKFSRDTLHRPIRNLIDLMATMGDFIRRHETKFPRKIKVETMATWLEMGSPQIPAQKLWNWRRGRDAFLLEDLDVVWRRFAGVYDDEIRKRAIPSPPIPLFVAAQIWEHLQLQIDRKQRSGSLFIIQPWYLWWWEHHRACLAAKGITWGNRPWPACIRNQSSWSGARSPDSSLSSQSSGRSSNSRDSQ